jgi:hypothetical protein
MVKCSLHLICQYLAEEEKTALYPAGHLLTVPDGMIFLAVMTLAAS